MSNKAFHHFLLFLWTMFAFCATEEVALGITQNFTGVAMNASGGLEYIEQHALSYDPRGLLESQTT